MTPDQHATSATAQDRRRWPKVSVLVVVASATINVLFLALFLVQVVGQPTPEGALPWLMSALILSMTTISCLAVVGIHRRWNDPLITLLSIATGTWALLVVAGLAFGVLGSAV